MPKIFEDDFIVVRGEWINDEFRISIHQKKGESELVPRGYWLGSNFLVYKKP